MHRIKLMPRPAIFSVMLSCMFLAATANQAAAQLPLQVEVVPINGTKTISVKPAKVVKVNVVKPGIVRVDVAADAQTVLVTGKKPGKTRIEVTDDTGRLRVLDVLVQTDVEYLRFLIKRAAPTANVEPVPVGNKVIILSGTVKRASDIPLILATAQSVAGNGVVNGMRVGGVQQVMLKVVIAQVSRNELRNMSFSFFTEGQQFFFGSALSAANAANSTLTPGTTATEALLSGSSNLLFGFIDDQTGFFGFLNALRNEGLAKFLAEPCLTTMSGRPASFLSGGRLAIPEPSGLGTNSVRFENFGTELNFLPIIKGNGKIYIEVEPVVNNINAALGTTIQGTTVPGFDTQRLHTSVEMEPGQTFVLGGLIQSEVNASTSKVPLAGDLPFIGTAFRTVNYNQVERELLIIITPYLVDPSTCDQLPKHLPGQETRIVDDFELFLEGILEAPRGPRRVFDRCHYRPAYLNGPTASAYPCPGAHYGHCGGCPTGGCPTGGCPTCPGGAPISSGFPVSSGPIAGGPISGVPVQNIPQSGVPTNPAPVNPAPTTLPGGQPAPLHTPRTLPTKQYESMPIGNPNLPTTPVDARNNLPVPANPLPAAPNAIPLAPAPTQIGAAANLPGR